MAGITQLHPTDPALPIRPDGTFGQVQAPGESYAQFATRLGYNADGTPRAVGAAAQDKVSQESLGRAVKPATPVPAAATLATTDYSKQSLG